MPDPHGWEVLATLPGVADHPGALPEDGWLPGVVPGTAAMAVRAVEGEPAARELDVDAHDWWWRGRLALPSAGCWELRFDGIATASTVWVDGVEVASGTSMWRAVVAEIELAAGDHEVVVRVAALTPLLAPRRPRPRWRTSLVGPPSLRWWRTTALGRMPAMAPDLAPAGPWRDVHLRPALADDVVGARVHTRVVDGVGVVHAHVRLRASASGPAVLRVGDHASTLVASPDGRDLHGQLEVADPPLWWPHPYGDQPLLPAVVEIGARAHALGRVGFRDLAARRDDGGFALVVNGVPIFARGACWLPPDPVGLRDPQATRESLALLRESGAVMVRVMGTTVYEDRTFWDTCDELGLLVWQDAMLTSLDPPEDPGWLADLHAELVEVLEPLAGRPSLAVVCGGSETEQQPAMLGLNVATLPIPAITDVVPAAVAQVVPGTPYVTSSPSGGVLPFHVGAGVAQYFGVGGYRRPPEDVRTAGVRFAAECLALACPPEQTSLTGWFDLEESAVRGHAWREGVARDAGADWDFEDVVDHYVRTWAGHDPQALRRDDPAHALDVSRATCAALVGEVMGWWRRPTSGCSGALVLASRDLRPGAGWGLLDAAGRPKAPWWVLRRTMAPTAALLTDLGLDGLEAVLVNDTATPRRGTLQVRATSADGAVDLRAEHPVDVPARASTSVLLDAVLGFRDLAYVYRFGPRTYDAVAVTWCDDDTAETLGEAVHLVGGPVPTSTEAAGLQARGGRDADGGAWVEVSAARLAPWVVVDLPGWRAQDSWFTLLPGQSRTVPLHPDARGPATGSPGPIGEVRTVGSRDRVRVVVAGPAHPDVASGRTA